MNRQKMNLVFIFTFYYKYLKYRIICNLRNKNSFVFNTRIRTNGFVGVKNGKAEEPVRTPTANGANKRLVSNVRLGCGSLSITTLVSLLAIEFDVRRVLHGKVSLAAVNQIYVVHEDMNGCKNLKIH